MPEPQEGCRRHPQAKAGWTCNWCRAPLCADCVALQFGGRTSVEQCCLCGGQAPRIQRRRSDIPYLQRLPGALVFPLSTSGLVAILAAGVFVYVLRHLGTRGEMFAQALLWGYVFNIIRAAARGKTEIEPPEFTGLADLFVPAFHGGLATMVIWLPALVYGIWGRPAIWPEPELSYYGMSASMTPGMVGMGGMPSGAMPAVPEVEPEPSGEPSEGLGEPGEVGEGGEAAGVEGLAAASAGAPRADVDDHHGRPTQKAGLQDPAKGAKPRKGPPPVYLDPILWLLLVLGVFYAPMALTIAAAGGSWVDMLSPFRVVMAIKRIPSDYLVLVGAAGCAALMMAFASVIGTLIDGIPVPLFPGVIAGMLSTYPALVTGQAFGLLLYVRGADLGFLPPEDAFEPTGDTSTPRGAPYVEGQRAEPGAAPEAAPGSAIEARFGPIAAAAVAAQAPAPDPRYAPIALDSEPEAHAAPRSAPAPVPVPPTQALQQALAAGDPASVAALYASASGPLPAALHFEVARAVGGAGNNVLALQALKAVVQAAPQDPLAPQALVLAARVYGERLGDAATAAKILAHVVANYPGTEAAAYAQQRLAAAGG